jgi:hypothetical protein
MGGGDEGNEALGSAELYDPNTGQFTAAGDMQAPRYYFKSFLLSDGRVLVATGNNGHNDERTIEIYNPSTGKFEDGGSSGSRGFYLVAPTSGGRFLFISGWDSSLLATKDAGALETCDLYDPSTRRLAPAPAIGVAPTDLADAIPLTDGRVVVLTQKGTLIYQP